MPNDQMREAFEAAMVRRFGCAEGEFKRDAEGCYVNRSWHDAFIGWQAGVVAGMERAKVIAIACDMGGLSVGDVIDAIRAEIKGTGHEG